MAIGNSPTQLEVVQAIKALEDIPPGIDGKTWYSGTTTPAGSTGVVGDWYLRTNMNEVYEKTGASTWTLRMNIKGAAGDPGAKGDKGDKGDTGDTGNAGPNQVSTTTDSTITGLLKGAAGKVAAAEKADITALGIPAQDTVYTHPTTAGNKHIPSGGTSGQVLKYSADGTAAWGADNDTIYTHPVNHPASIITQDANNRFVTDTEKTTWNGKLDKSGGTMTGALVAGGTQALTTAQVRNVTLSTADPSGGSNGDLWFKYEV